MQNDSSKLYDPKSDRLLVKKVKCPYCKAKIPAFQSVCSQCGISKEQIANASNEKAKQMMRDGEYGKIVMISRRPDDVNFSKLSLILFLLGIFGAHCFYVGRKIRGWIILSCMIAFIICLFLFPIGTWNDNIIDVNGEVTQGYEGMHPWRESVEDAGYFFPTDFLGVTSLIMWAMDAFAIVFGWFKYPVRLGERTSNAK